MSSKNYCADRITGKQVVQTLKLGASGSDVVKLQKRLQELGFNPGSADGKLGPKTEASLKQFQSNQGFLADGIAGPKTLAALFPGEPLRLSLLSDRAIGLILEFEVGGGRKYYEKLLQRPTWPEGASGITIGIGYDLGYNSLEVFNQDWHKLGDADRKRLSNCCGLKGESAKSRLASVRDILISWELAWEVFNIVTIPKFYNFTKEAFPGFEELPADVQGGLVSLVFNRGTSMEGNRRREMRAIRDLVRKKDVKGIAEQIREMKRIWVGTSIATGINRRRDAEAALIEESA
ncbi:peptidoglycan-binding protein [Tychonema sp. LEGE 07199]|nr:peptidoglycan-binding protein [Tychonema sp. LEGE 07199]MBE9130655.1 peptidoglycan-binding protein [Tychonema sp. LEGE 07196]